MTLAQRRVVHDFETNRFPAFKKRVDEAAGIEIPLEVHWDTLATPDESHLYAQSWPALYFEPLIEALKTVAGDELGREAIRAGLKKIVVQNQKGCSYGSCWAALEDGILTLDHALANVSETEERKNGLVAVLENGL
jgi:hypothetical protein